MKTKIKAGAKIQDEIPSVRSKIKTLFKTLRKEHKFFARMTWKCCSSCGWAAIPEKHQNSPVKRDVVQVLRDRLRTTGAHKGILVATTTFQRGAIEYAKTHGIALVQITGGLASYRTKSQFPAGRPPLLPKIPDYVGWLTSLTEDDKQSRAVVSAENPEYLREFLFRNPNRYSYVLSKSDQGASSPLFLLMKSLTKRVTGGWLR